MAVQGRETEEPLQGTSPVYDGEDQVQDGVTGRETEEPLQGTSLVPDGEDRDQDGVTGRETDEAHPETNLVHGGEYEAQDVMVNRLSSRRFFSRWRDDHLLTDALTDYEHQVQGLDGGTGRETEEPLQGTSLVPDGEDQGSRWR
ncbi:uncharacterized protein LOC124274564 [Haliotis rubra]|uniref:uncharacterized protein LOC124274564 n=1 Tax=Haliotis rubra TaxID=36100 RepID=UPI001EE50C95|nr:uncharacterized protein LOC124274564 [Haliotis rubra]